MKRKKTKSKSYTKMILEEFSSFGEFTDTIQNREPNPEFKNYKDEFSKDVKDSEWRGEENYETAKSKLINGDDSLVKSMKVKIKANRSELKPERTKAFNDVVGYQANIPNAIMGLPNSMINTRKMMPKKVKVLDVTYAIDRSVSLSPDQVQEYGAKVVNYLKALEMKGYRIRLSVVASFSEQEGPWHVVKIRVKNENQPFNLKRIAYPMASIATLRYLCFDWYETLPDGEYLWGYGTPVNHWSKKKRKEFEENVSDSSIYITYNDDLDKIFSGCI